MHTHDNNLRQQAVPYQGQIFGYNRSENSEQDISQTLMNPPTQHVVASLVNPSMSGKGDLAPLIFNNTGNYFPIRILRPKFGQIVQAYLTIGLTFSASETSPLFSVYVGSGFQTDGLTPSTPTLSFINQCMNVINPSSNYFTGVAGQMYYKLVNILPLIPQVGDTNYNENFYVVGLYFPQAPVMSGLWHLYKFNVTGSIIVV